MQLAQRPLEATGPTAENIELLETIRAHAQGAKADLMKAAVKENQLWQAITRYQDIVHPQLATTHHPPPKETTQLPLEIEGDQQGHREEGASRRKR